MFSGKRNKPRVEDTQPSSPAWMLTYGDMVTLLLTFFVLLLSFATFDLGKFNEVANSLTGALGILKGETSIVKNRSLQVTEVDRQRKLDILDVIRQLNRLAYEKGFQNDISSEITATGMLIRMGNRVLFDVGKAELKPEAYPILDLVGETIKKRAKEVLVSGHTDNTPIHTPDFPSNWELSVARALTVVKYLINHAHVPPEILAATGYGEYRPLVPNTNSANRQRNRRVEFLITWK